MCSWNVTLETAVFRTISPGPSSSFWTYSEVWYDSSIHASLTSTSKRDSRVLCTNSSTWRWNQTNSWLVNLTRASRWHDSHNIWPWVSLSSVFNWNWEYVAVVLFPPPGSATHPLWNATPVYSCVTAARSEPAPGRVCLVSIILLWKQHRAWSRCWEEYCLGVRVWGNLSPQAQNNGTGARLKIWKAMSENKNLLFGLQFFQSNHMWFGGRREDLDMQDLQKDCGLQLHI